MEKKPQAVITGASSAKIFLSSAMAMLGLNKSAPIDVHNMRVNNSEFNFRDMCLSIMQRAKPRGQKTGNRGNSQMPTIIQHKREVNRDKVNAHNGLRGMLRKVGKKLDSKNFTKNELKIQQNMNVRYSY